MHAIPCSCPRATKKLFINVLLLFKSEQQNIEIDRTGIDDTRGMYDKYSS
jgi:hypothetical protein